MIKDSGSRRKFETGAVRDAQGYEPDGTPKGRFDLIPIEVLRDIAVHYQMGAEKYPPDADGTPNWQKGIPIESYFDSAMRHMIKAKLGWDDEDHISACVWNLMGWAWEERYSPRADRDVDGGYYDDDWVKKKYEALKERCDDIARGNK